MLDLLIPLWKHLLQMKLQTRNFFSSLRHTKCSHIQGLAANIKVESADTILEKFSQKTQMLLPLPSDLSNKMENSVLSERERILSKVKEYINKNLEPENEIFWPQQKLILRRSQKFQKFLQSSIEQRGSITVPYPYHVIQIFRCTSKDNQMTVLLIIFSVGTYVGAFGHK